jgi:peptidoglycan/LPS O-acetylase OafA/YrhL
VQPSLLAGESDGVVLVSQYNPHGVFIALENVGYVALAVAFLFLSRVVTGEGWLVRALRWLLVLAGAVTLVALVIMSWWFGMDLGYRFEVVAISITWIAVIGSSALLAVWLRRPTEGGPQEG